MLHQFAVVMLPSLIAAGMLCRSPGHHDTE